MQSTTYTTAGGNKYVFHQGVTQNPAGAAGHIVSCGCACGNISTGNPLMRGIPPQKGDCPPHDGGPDPPHERSFYIVLCIITGKRAKIARSDNDVYEGSCVLTPCTNL